ncbi:thioredoxin fold domain-containing protein [Tamlana haliotis]|uniref:Thioredoxin fold domain-containing protein n=1 Tax=Pseudotamlana haliotis TaxID=2614804 RepID=A0A6N6MBD4_9FLAO|nr:thioredoxin family protein [Tamlana haliotis]KAB1066886.1 thioredoxin fold domain-containing protein [Tamlana haliotis]
MLKFSLFIFICLGSYSNAISQKTTEIHWKTFPELEIALKENPKPVFIFFHAEWCAYCKKIERKIFTKPEVINMINSEFYAVEMDVETQDSIVFDNVTFTNKQAQTQRNGKHEIPLLLATREGFPFTLPATIILNKDFTINNRVFEYYTSNKLLEILKSAL